jgi:hypothetical protein
MQRKKIIWTLLVGCTSVVIFFPVVFQSEMRVFPPAQTIPLGVRTTTNNSVAELQVQEPASEGGTQLSKGAPQLRVSHSQQNESESQQSSEIIPRSPIAQEFGGQDMPTIPARSSPMPRTENEIAGTNKPQQPDRKQRFIKIDASGKQLADDADNWACVYDSKTRLLWESNIGMSHELRYRWSEPSVKEESPEHCPYFAGNLEDNIENCTTSLRVSVANSTQLCGSSAWQVPNIAEFETIIMSGQYNPSINTRYFPYTQSDYYWTREGFAYSELNAWAVTFHIGRVNDVAKTEFIYIRLVNNEAADNF